MYRPRYQSGIARVTRPLVFDPFRCQRLHELCAALPESCHNFLIVRAPFGILFAFRPSLAAFYFDYLGIGRIHVAAHNRAPYRHT